MWYFGGVGLADLAGERGEGRIGHQAHHDALTGDARPDLAGRVHPGQDDAVLVREAIGLGMTVVAEGAAHAAALRSPGLRHRPGLPLRPADAGPRPGPDRSVRARAGDE
ncbi:hypothetical protein AB0M46_32035 [Dactylosporangium sp. NPDC051485]|uniref:hypothetical protein n=1 Tax=Dactylosporangium sp. NPDC051485 TaxID=3154846 RepID=UPI003436879A